MSIVNYTELAAARTRCETGRLFEVLNEAICSGDRGLQAVLAAGRLTFNGNFLFNIPSIRDILETDPALYGTLLLSVKESDGTWEPRRVSLNNLTDPSAGKNWRDACEKLRDRLAMAAC